MIDKAHDQTDELLKKIEKRIKSEYKKANKDIEDKLNKYLEAFEKKDKEKRLLFQKGEITKKAYDDWRTQQIMVGDRWKAMLDVLSEDYLNADKLARSIVNGYMPEVYALNHNYGTYQIEQGTSLNTSYTLYNAQSVERLIKDNPNLLPKSDSIEELIRDNKVKRWNAQKINSAVLQGLLQGEAIPKIAKRLRNVTDMDYRASIRNARTMVTSTENRGRLDAYKRAESMGIETYKQWLAIHDNRTRHEHRLLDRQIQPLDSPFVVDGEEIMHPGDEEAPARLVYNCRCAIKSVFPKKDGSYLGASYTSDVVYDKKLGTISYDEWKNGRKIKTNDKKPKIQVDEKAYKALKFDVEDYKVEYIEPKELKSLLSEQEIITKLGGGDMTSGSCTSLTFAYAGNKCGLDVTDFRGGGSQEVFSDKQNAKRMHQMAGAKIETHSVKKEAKEVSEIIKNIEPNKEFILNTGKHSAIIKKENETLQYLELQSATNNGWKPFEDKEKNITVEKTLINRFGCRKNVDKLKGSSRIFEKEVVLVEVDSYNPTDEFKEMLGYINTPTDKQKKGVKGGIR